MREFKVGDKVYCPSRSTAVLAVVKNNSDIDYSRDNYPLMVTIGDNSFHFNNDGRCGITECLPVVFRATPENNNLLNKLYGIEFEKPHVQLTSK